MLGALSLSSCKRPAPNAVDVPKDISSITLPFIEAVKGNNITKAEKYISRYERDDLTEQLAADHLILAKTPALKPVNIEYNRDAFGQIDKDTVKIWYVGNDRNTWTDVEIKLGRSDGSAYEIDYYEVTQASTKPAIVAQQETIRTWILIGSIAIAALGSLFLIALVWFARRKSHIISPDQVIDSRPIAITQQDE